MTTDDHGCETEPRLQPVIERLLSWQQEVVAQISKDPRVEAERIGLANRIDTAVRLLQRCDEFDVAPGASWDAAPDIISSSYQPDVRIVDDRESDNPASWRELAFGDGVTVRLLPGSVIVGGFRSML